MRLTYDNNYFNALYQGIPAGGYTAMMETLLDGIETRLNTDFLSRRGELRPLADRLIYPATDAQGDVLSGKNETYCKLTALYWIWKNCRADYAGLVHYRRYFGVRRLSADRWKRIASGRQLQRLIQKHEVILPKKRHYWIETSESQFAHAHHRKDLAAARRCVEAMHPDYLPAFDRVLGKTAGHRFNMMIMSKPMLDDYCAWLFGILFRLENEIDVSDYDAYQRRVFGFIGERLLDVWLEQNAVQYTELPLVNTEPVHRIPKGFRFLKRKFAGRSGG